MKRYRSRALAAVAVSTILPCLATVAHAQVPAAPASGTPIVVLQTVTVDSTVVSFPGLPVGAKVAVAAINAAGGINGHPIKLMICDDKINPSLAAGCVQQAVSAGAVARVGSLSLLGSVIEPLLERAQMADVASIASAPELTSPISYPISAGQLFQAGVGPLAKKKYPKAKTYSIVSSTVPGADVRAQMVAYGATRVGLQRVDNIFIPTGTADLSSIVGQLQRGNPDLVFAILGGQDIQKYASAAAALNYTTPKFQGLGGVTPDILNSLTPAGAAASNWVDFYPPYLGNTPGAADFRKQMATFAPGQPLNRDAWVGWLGFQTFAHIAQSIKGPITNRSVLGTMQNVKCLTFLYLKCVNFSKPGPVKDYPAARVGSVFLEVNRGANLFPTRYTASAFG